MIVRAYECTVNAKTSFLLSGRNEYFYSIRTTSLALRLGMYIMVTNKRGRIVSHSSLLIIIIVRSLGSF